MTDALKKIVHLQNHKTSEELSFTLRPFVHGDEESVMNCVYEEYGDSYYRREFYDRALLEEIIDKGKLNLFIANCGDEICGIQTIISHSPEETRVEAASQIFRKKYRGFGLPFELVKFTYEFAETLHPSCIYASCVVFHNITQKMCEEVGMIPVAFNLGSHLTSAMNNSFPLGDSEKYAQAILIKPVDKKIAGDIFIHPEIAKTTESIYDKLGVKYNIISSPEYIPADCDYDNTLYSVKENMREQCLYITIKRIGRDFTKVVSDLRSSHSEKFWTIQLILPVDSPYSIRAYEELKELGFFFAGARPLCSEKEQIFMQYTGDVYFNFHDFKLTEDFAGILRQIVSYKNEGGK